MEPFDLYSPLIDADPFPYYAELRDKYPCYWSDGAQLWILSRYDDIVEAARDWQTFSSAAGNMIDELPGRAGATLGTTDPPRHDRLRALSQAAFLKRNLDRLVAPTLEIADRSLDRIVEQRHVRVHQRLSSQITVGFLFRTMGLPRPRSCRHQAQGHSCGFDRQEREGADAGAHRRVQGAGRFPHRRSGGATGQSDRRFDHSSRRSRDRRRPALGTRGRADDGDIRHGRRRIVVELHEHVRAQSPRLSGCPTAARCRSGADRAAIEESLRFNTSAQRFKRAATRDITLHGETIHAGDKVALAFGSGNRDRRKFPDPDLFDIDRRPQGHLGFGSGKHFCLGSQMARLVTEVAMRRFLDRVPDYHLTVDKVAWNSSSNFRSPTALPFARGA